MKTLLSIILFIALSLSINAQNLRITIGRGTNCFGRGACSIELSSFESRNAAFLTNENGENILRIYREQLSLAEENNILEAPVQNTSTGSNKLKFVLNEPLLFPESIRHISTSKNGENLPFLPPGEYTTSVSRMFIDILLNNE
ncbi:MAG: hypothetical protein AAFP76_08960 [Bacteroidota bacterium]